MFKFLIGLAAGFAFAYNAAQHECDRRITGLFTPDNYRAMQPSRNLGDPTPMPFQTCSRQSFCTKAE